jgi:hypothetical protein
VLLPKSESSNLKKYLRNLLREAITASLSFLFLKENKKKMSNIIKNNSPEEAINTVSAEYAEFDPDPNKIILDEEKDKNLIESWYIDAKKQSINTLPDFINHIINGYTHDYGSIVHAIGACCVATAWATNRMEGACGGITGFQASFVMWDFIRHWRYPTNKLGLKLIDYDDMLYPQYAENFDKVMTSEQFEELRKEAVQKLEDLDLEKESFGYSSPVIAHWKDIASGNPPFGYRIKDEVD